MGKAKYTKNKRGYYQAQIWDGKYNKDGSKHRKAIYSSKSSKDLEEKVAAFKAELNQKDRQIPSDISFVDYAKKWFKIKKNIRAKNTQRMYKNVIDKFFPEIDGIPLAEIRHSQIQALINSHIDSPKSCEDIILTVNQVLKMALADSYITTQQFQKITSDLAVPKYKAPEKRPLTPAEKEALKTANFTDRERAFVSIIYSCGLRRGETLALTSDDFTFEPEKSAVTISKTIIFDGNNPEIKPSPKSDNGFRKVPIPDKTAKYLKEYIQGLNQDHLFINQTNKKLITLSGFYKMWGQIVKKMNYAAGGTDLNPVIIKLTPHIFRHNYCTSLCYQIPAISIKKIAALMGVTDKMVLEVYNHIQEENEDVYSIINAKLSI